MSGVHGKEKVDSGLYSLEIAYFACVQTFRSKVLTHFHFRTWKDLIRKTVDELVNLRDPNN